MVYIYIYIVESEKEGKYTKSMSIGHDDDMISVPIKGQLYWGSRCDWDHTMIQFTRGIHQKGKKKNKIKWGINFHLGT